MKNSRLLLIVGDAIALAILTVIGFASHGETDISFAPRMLTTFIPLLVGWFLLAPWFRLFDPDAASAPKQLWRPALVMLFAAPLATVLRAAMLNSAALPLFALILGGSSAIGMVVWRGVYFLWRRRA
ncbi:MAG: DUF3054 domain-containing protein [Chloroflexota bacterium]